MASLSRIDLGLNLGLTQQTGELAPRAAVWHPNFVTSKGPVTIIDSVLRDNEVAAGVARGMLTPRDLHILGKKSEHMAVEDAMALSVQSAASIANLGQRLLAKNQEVQELMTQLGIQRSAMKDCHNMIQELRDELSRERERNSLDSFQLRHTIDELHMVVNRQKIELKNERRAATTEQRRLEKEKAELSKIADRYSSEMKQRMEIIERSSKRVREDHEKVFADVRAAKVSAVTRESVIAEIFGGPSAEVRGVRISEPRAEGQGSRPAAAGVTGQSARSVEATGEVQGPSTGMEAESAKPSETQDEDDGVPRILGFSILDVGKSA